MITQAPRPIAPGWLLAREPQPGLKGAAAVELLERSAKLPGTFRLTTDGRHVEKIGEVRDNTDPLREQELDQDLVGSLLEERCQGWKRREPGWVIPASPRCPQEVVLTPGEGGLRVEAVLVSWDDITPVQKEALARFLCRAQAGLRFARCELASTQAVVAANLPGADVEAGLEHAVLAVQAASRRLQREAAALLSDDLAAEYLKFFAAPGEITAAAGR